jgi:hypothetical protein
LICVSDVVLAFVDSRYSNVCIALLLGFALNYTRITLRRDMLEMTHTAEAAHQWAVRITAVNQITKSAAPIGMALVIAWLGASASPYLFAGIGLVVVLGMSLQLGMQRQAVQRAVAKSDEQVANETS